MFVCPTPSCSGGGGINYTVIMDNSNLVGTTGTWSGSGASVLAPNAGTMAGDTAFINTSLMVANVTYNLTLTLTTLDRCSEQFSCQFSLNTNCGADGGRF